MGISLENEIGEELAELAAEGSSIATTASVGFSELSPGMTSRMSAWVVRCQNIMLSLAPNGGPFYQQLQSIISRAEGYPNGFFTGHSNWHLHLSAAAGCVQGFHAEFKRSGLRPIRAIVEADIFSDFLEMSEHLLSNGYKDAAAVMIGSTLEEHIRKLALRNGISLEDVKPNDDRVPKKADRLNAELAQSVYGKLDQKSVSTWLDLRNKAAHAHYNEYTKEQVDHMLQGVMNFMARHS